jgi:hypothetical protein
MIEFEPQYYFDDLRGFGGKPLTFDFYLKFPNMLIEYDGEQHFRPVRFNGLSEECAKDNFKKVKISSRSVIYDYKAGTYPQKF